MKKNHIADEKKLEEVRSLSRLLDSKFRLPGTQFSFGIDPIIGLIPGIGDLIGFGLSGYIVLKARRLGASGMVMVRMLLNIAIDMIIGAIPLLGSIFDFAFKANNKNVKLLEKHISKGKYQGSGKGLIFLIILGICTVFVMILYMVFQLLHYIFSLF